MKNINKIALALFLLAISMSANAQLKIAHIDANDVYYKMPEYKIAGMKTDSVKSVYEKEIASLKSELERKYNELQSLPATTPDLIKQSKGKDFEGAQQSAQEFVQKADEDIQAQDARFKEPVLKKLKATIEIVAKEKGYSYVFDDQALLVKPEGDDITMAVKAKLGINATTPLPAPQNPAPKQK